MIEVVIVGITMCLILIASTFYRGGKRRVHLLRIACAGLFVATLCRGLEPVFNGVGIDLLKRWAILAAQVGIVLLVLTFRKQPVPPSITRGIWIGAGIVAAGELALAGFLPVHADGEVYHQSEIEMAAAQGEAWSLLSYHALYLSAFAAATGVVAVACWRVMMQTGQSLVARLPVAFVFAGAVGSAAFIVSSIADLFDVDLLGGTEVRSIILIAVVTCFFLGLLFGVVRGVSITLRKTVAIHFARELVLPLWRTTTKLHPDVRLPVEDQRELGQLMALSRLTIETHDALRLIREDDDPALADVHAQHPEDPHLSAELVRRLSGEHSVPPLGWFTVALTRLRTFHLTGDESLASSVRSLYEIRMAMTRLAEQKG